VTRVATADNVADVLTKPLPPEKHRQFAARLRCNRTLALLPGQPIAKAMRATAAMTATTEGSAPAWHAHLGRYVAPCLVDTGASTHSFDCPRLALRSVRGTCRGAARPPRCAECGSSDTDVFGEMLSCPECGQTLCVECFPPVAHAPCNGPPAPPEPDEESDERRWRTVAAMMKVMPINISGLTENFHFQLWKLADLSIFGTRQVATRPPPAKARQVAATAFINAAIAVLAAATRLAGYFNPRSWGRPESGTDVGSGGAVAGPL